MRERDPRRRMQPRALTRGRGVTGLGRVGVRRPAAAQRRSRRAASRDRAGRRGGGRGAGGAGERLVGAGQRFPQQRPPMTPAPHPRRAAAYRPSCGRPAH